ncbi:MAG: PBP1A family penicillin-binding protein [Aerococcus sp.]|nr:PBP1A family penicillin-binding protein [Aerococcus sp.]
MARDDNQQRPKRRHQTPPNSSRAQRTRRTSSSRADQGARQHYKEQNPSKKSKQTAPQKKNHKEKNSHSILKMVAIGAVLVVAAIGITGTAIAAAWISDSPEITKRDLEGSVASVVYDEDGNEVYKTTQNEQIIIDSDQISQQAFDAVTSIEDRRFMDHHGIDIRRIFASLMANLRAGGIAQGGSTLTQQLVKLSVFSTKEEDRTYKRKVQEMYLAHKIEKQYSKQQIFEYYLNKVYMANGVYGIGTAAQIYYGKPLDQLTLTQVALLAGMPQAPNEYNPYVNPEQAKERRDLVLVAMRDNEKISDSDYQQAVNEPIDEGLQSLEEFQETDRANDNVVDAYVKQVIKDVEDAGYNIFEDGLEIHTHLNMDIQRHLYDTVNDDNGVYFPNDTMQSAVSIVNTKNGHIAALFGGRHQEAQLGFNRATELNRSVGSTMKPLADYGPVFEYLNYSPGQTVKDEPHTYSDGTEIKNYEGGYMGNLTLRQALVRSRNIPALKMMQASDPKKVNEFLGKMDIHLNGGKGVYESNALGGEVTPLGLSAAYATIGNYGQYNQPRAVDYFVTKSGEKIKVSQESHRAMKDSTAYMLTDVLKGTFKDDGLAASNANPNIIQAGKTGTTNYTEEELTENGIPSDGSPDSWIAGFTTDYAIAVWVGYDKPYSPDGYLSLSDQTIARALYQNLMEFITNGSHQDDWEQPDSVHRVNIISGSNPLRISQSSGGNTISDLVNDELYKQLQSRGYGQETNESSSSSQNTYNPQNNGGNMNGYTNQSQYSNNQWSRSTNSGNTQSDTTDETTDGGTDNTEGTQPNDGSAQEEPPTSDSGSGGTPPSTQPAGDAGASTANGSTDQATP